MAKYFKRGKVKAVLKQLLEGGGIILAMTFAVLLVNPETQIAGAAYFNTKSFCGILPCPEGSTGVEMAKSLVGRLWANTKFLIGAVAVAMIIVSGVKLITAGGNEEVFTKQSQTLLYAVIGLFIIGLAGDLASIFEVDRGGFLRDGATAIQKTRLFNRTVEIVITFIKYIIGAIAIVYIIRNGLRMIMMGGNDDEMAKDKKNIAWSLAGLVLILMANPIVTKVFFSIDTNQYPGIDVVRPGINIKKLIGEIVGVTNLVAAITGPVAILSLVIGGVMYSFAGGNDELQGKAKKIITWALIGIVVIYGSFALVSTFVARQFEGL